DPRLHHASTCRAEALGRAHARELAHVSPSSWRTDEAMRCAVARRRIEASPTTPLGRNSVTRMNSSPRKNSQYSGKDWVKKLLAPLINPAPNTGPSSVPRPPTATQIAISIEFAGDISPGLMIPT